MKTELVIKTVLCLVLVTGLVSCSGSDNLSNGTDPVGSTGSGQGSAPQEPQQIQPITPEPTVPLQPLTELELDKFSFDTSAAGDQKLDYQAMIGDGYLNVEMTYNSQHFVSLGFGNAKPQALGVKNGNKFIARMAVQQGDDVYAILMWAPTGMTVDYRIWWTVK